MRAKQTTFDFHPCSALTVPALILVSPTLPARDRCIADSPLRQSIASRETFIYMALSIPTVKSACLHVYLPVKFGMFAHICPPPRTVYSNGVLML